MKFSLKKCVSLALAAVMSAGILSGCGNSDKKESTSKGKDANTIVYGISTSPLVYLIQYLRIQYTTMQYVK